MREKILKILKNILDGDVITEITVPEETAFGHYSTNAAMRLSKAQGKNPMELAEEFASKIRKDAPMGFFEKVEVVKPGFINFWLTPTAVQAEFQTVAHAKDYGKNDSGKKKTAIVEYSAVNIAKIMNLGHFRTTIIGDALANILEFSGYKVVRWNYLGDWGTQFGKLIAAYKLWGKKKDIEKNPVEELQKLYVRFHEEEKADPALEKRGQEEFKKLEDGDKENRRLWEWFKKESLAEFKKTYAILGVDFDVWIGESFFEDDLARVTRELADKKLVERSEGALIVRLDSFNLPPGMIEKSDGASLYLTRDIANLEYRLKKYQPAKILYVVANEQSLHFEQLFAVAKLAGLAPAELKHLKYGLVLGESGKKLSTREGRTVSVREVLDKAITLARTTVEEKNRDLSPKEKDEVGKAVALGALKYNDLKENRMTDIVFDWGKMLDFSGDSGPYLQYTYARIQSILRKAGKVGAANVTLLETDNELALMRKLFDFPEIVLRAGELYSTSVLATYLYRLAVATNKFYETTPILKDENAPRRNARLVLASTAAVTLQKGLALLGIQTPEKI